MVNADLIKLKGASEAPFPIAGGQQQVAQGGWNDGPREGSFFLGVPNAVDSRDSGSGAGRRPGFCDHAGARRVAQNEFAHLFRPLLVGEMAGMADRLDRRPEDSRPRWPSPLAAAPPCRSPRRSGPPWASICGNSRRSRSGPSSPSCRARRRHGPDCARAARKARRRAVRSSSRFRAAGSRPPPRRPPRRTSRGASGLRNRSFAIDGKR